MHEALQMIDLPRFLLKYSCDKVLEKCKAATESTWLKRCKIYGRRAGGYPVVFKICGKIKWTLLTGPPKKCWRWKNPYKKGKVYLQFSFFLFLFLFYFLFFFLGGGQSKKSPCTNLDNKCSTYTICVNNKEINITLCVFLGFLVPLKLGLVLEKCAAREQSREYVP